VTPEAGSDRSMSKTAAPAQAAWYATEAPTMPAPTTTTSVPGEPRTRDRIPAGNGNCPSRRSPNGTRSPLPLRYKCERPARRRRVPPRRYDRLESPPPRRRLSPRCRRRQARSGFSRSRRSLGQVRSFSRLRREGACAEASRRAARPSSPETPRPCSCAGEGDRHTQGRGFRRSAAARRNARSGFAARSPLECRTRYGATPVSRGHLTARRSAARDAGWLDRRNSGFRKADW